MLFTLAGPIAASFEKKINYKEKWIRAFASILLPAIFFILWDILFTSKGVWSFNPAFHLGLELFHLPLEEYLFFLAVPFACLFIMENIWLAFGDRDGFDSKPVTLTLIAILISLVFIYNDRLYTVTTFSMLIVALAYYEYIQKISWLNRFYVGWAVCLIPFFIVNGILTYLPVVIYDNSENMGLRLGSIPFEDMFYGMLLMLLISGYYFEDKKGEAGNELYISDGVPGS
jgi:lycopene cyclase domain-containing protein